MRPFLILAAIAALPALVIAHRNHFLAAQQGPLLARVFAALDDPKFSGVKQDESIINYLDISLAGRVADPAAREEARRRVADVPGVRCREMDNQLLITPVIHARLDGETLSLSGWLRDEAALNTATRWLKESRPGLKVNSAGMQLSPYTARVDAPRGATGGTVPAEFAEAWNRIRIDAALKIEKKGNSIRASGALPSAGLRDSVVVALLGAGPKITLDSARLRAGACVKAARFAHESALPELLLGFFSQPGAASFEAGGAIRLYGHATPEQEREWNTAFAELADKSSVKMELRVVPSVYHLPGYKPQSPLAPDALQALRAALATAPVHFDYAIHSVSPEEMNRMNTAAQAILAAGPAARIIVGAHLDWVGEPRLNDDSARRRAATVIAELKTRGVPAAQLEPAVFSVAPGPDGGDQGRTVELLVK